MAEKENIVDILNDLVRINRDRITGYEKAAIELQDNDADLHGLFNSFATQSASLAAQLQEMIGKLGGKVVEGTTNAGKIYRVWMDLKMVLAGHDRLAILNSCEFGEDAAQKAYDEALGNENKLPGDVQALIENQKSELKKSHDQVKTLRDNLDQLYQGKE